MAGEALVARRASARVPVDPKDQILATILRRSLMTVETDARRLRLAIEQLERKATAEATRLAKEQDRAVRRMTGNISYDDDSNLIDGYSSNDDAPPAADAYTRVTAAPPTARERGQRGNRKFLRPAPSVRFI